MTTPPSSDVKTRDLYELSISLFNGKYRPPKLAMNDVQKIPKLDVNF